MDPDSLINRIIPTTDSLKAAVMDDLGWYKISTYCNVEGDAWWIQLIIAFIGAAVGGTIAGYITWKMGKKQADEQLQREVARDNLLKELERNRATLQKELEDHRDKRQNTWMLLQTMQEFASYILEADKYAGEYLTVQMQMPNQQKSVNYFGTLVQKIEFLWFSKSFLLDRNVAQQIKQIFSLMFNYQLKAMECTNTAPKDFAYHEGDETVFQNIDKLTKECQTIKASWNKIWDSLNSNMKKIREDVF